MYSKQYLFQATFTLLLALCPPQSVNAQTPSQNLACPGYWVMAELQGSPVTLTDGAGTYSGAFSPSNSTNSSLAEINTEAGGYFTFDFSAPSGQALAVGEYSNCTRYPFQSSTNCGLSISGHGRGCNILSGGFKVLEIERDGTGALTKFSANYVQDCENNGNKLYGQIRFRSTLAADLTCNGTTAPTPTPASTPTDGGGDQCETLTIGGTAFSLCDGKITDSGGAEAGLEIEDGTSSSVIAKGIKYTAKRAGDVITFGATIKMAKGKYVSREAGVRAYIISLSGGSKGLYLSSSASSAVSRIQAKIVKGKVTLKGVPNVGTIQ